MRPPRSLSDAELLDYADDRLWYAIDMLRWCTGILISLALVRHDEFLGSVCNDAMVNSFALHARNLVDFLYMHESGHDQATDIIVHDYIDQQTLDEHLPGITPVLKDARTRADRQAAPLTVDRLQSAQAGGEWNFKKTAEDIMAAFRAIAPHFPAARISDPLRQLISQPSLSLPSVATYPIRSKHVQSPGICLCVPSGTPPARTTSR